MPTRLAVLAARGVQIAIAFTVGWIVGTGVQEITEPWIKRLENRDIAATDAVRYVPETEGTDQERLDRVEAELEADA